MPLLFLSKLILSVSRYVVVIGAVSRAETDSGVGCNTCKFAADSTRICSIKTCWVSWSTSIIVASSSWPWKIKLVLPRCHLLCSKPNKVVSILTFEPCL
uniref:Putative secreted protein n=1 Tax=Panstrongylus lignarius TaxID=156445 RepID=A0A224Y3A5_9HEMI